MLIEDTRFYLDLHIINLPNTWCVILNKAWQLLPINDYPACFVFEQKKRITVKKIDKKWKEFECWLKIDVLKTVNIGKGKPNPNMTDKEWQDYLEIMKVGIPAGLKGTKRRREMSSKKTQVVVNGYNADNQFTYCGETQWASYVSYINNVLRTIRNGMYDYCYYIYQIFDLLTYEYENLRTEWIPEYGCFKVWLAGTLRSRQNNDIDN